MTIHVPDTTTAAFALGGGLLIGLSAVLMMTLLGRIAGISGITFAGFSSPRTNPWALAFVIGLPIGGWLWHTTSGLPIPAYDAPLLWTLVAGFTVGVGTKLGSGCTSGHGICGIGRLSTRSIIATVTFMTVGILTVTLRGVL